MQSQESGQSYKKGEQSQKRPRLPSNHEAQNDGKTVNKKLNTQSGAKFQQVRQNKREGQNRSQSGSVHAESLKKAQMEEQRAKEQIPPFAQLCADIIFKIAEFPKKEELQKSSLVDQICAMIKKLGQSHKQDKTLSEKINRLNQFFIDGIERRSYFDQDRISCAIIKKDNIIFHPTNIVTGQIMRQLVHQQLLFYTISYGHHGIAKTFGYYFYHELSNLFISETLNCSEQVKKLLEKKRIKQIPKLIYLNMSLKTKTFNQQNYQQKLAQSMMDQCPQIPLQIKQKFNGDYTQIASKICSFYKSKGVQVYLLVDQINSVASIFRKHIQNVKDDKLAKPTQYKAAEEINKIRIDLIKEGFSKIIYNSSVNFEYFYVSDDLSEKGLSKNNYSLILDKLKLNHDYPHQKTVKQYRILYPEIIKFDSSVWSLTDTIIFEMKRNKHQFTKEVGQKQCRQKIFLKLKERNNSTMTFLRIREIIKSMQQFDISDFLSQIKRTEKNTYIENLKSCYDKASDKIDYFKTLDTIYHNSKQMMNNQECQDFSEKSNIQKEIVKCLSFLDHPIYCNQISSTIFLNLDRNLFQPFSNKIKAKNYLFQLKNFAFKSIEKWDNKKIEQIKQKTIDIFESYQKNFSSKYFSIEQNKMVIVTMLPSKQLIRLIQDRLSQVDNFDLVDARKFLAGVPSYVIGYYLQRRLINYIQQAPNLVFKNQQCNLQIKNNTKISFPTLKMKQLPKLKSENKLEHLKKNKNMSIQNFLNSCKQNKQNPLRIQNLDDKVQLQYEEFVNQFLDQSRQAGFYLFVPQTSNSKSIDFAISQIFKFQKEDIFIKIYLFQVTVAGKSAISEKIQTFLEAYIYAADYLLKTQKFKSIANRKLKLKISYVLIGAPSNEAEMEISAIKHNSSALFKYISEKNIGSNVELKNITWINVNKMELPGVEKFPVLYVIRQLLKEIKSKSEQKEKKQNIPKKNGSKQQNHNDSQEN